MKYRIPLGFNRSKENKVKFITYSFLIYPYWFHFGICLPGFRLIFNYKKLKGVISRIREDYIEIEEKCLI